jgi:hypothetical protein
VTDRTPRSRDPLDIIEDLAFESELERVAALSPEALDAELREAGVDPGRAQEIVERALAEATAKQDATGAGPQEAGSSQSAAGERPASPALPDSRRVASAVATALEAPAPARERRPRAGRRQPRVVWIAVGVVSAAAVLAILLGTIGRGAIEAWLVPAPSGVPSPVPTRGPAPGPAPLEVAAELRNEAFIACGVHNLYVCQRGLDEAQALDPAGEDDPRVRAARALLTEAGRHGLEDKPARP